MMIIVQTTLVVVLAMSTMSVAMICSMRITVRLSVVVITMVVIMTIAMTIAFGSMIVVPMPGIVVRFMCVVTVVTIAMMSIVVLMLRSRAMRALFGRILSLRTGGKR